MKSAELLAKWVCAAGISGQGVENETWSRDGK